MLQAGVMFRVVKFGRYVIVHAICHVSLNVRTKGKKKRITLRAWATCGLTGLKCCYNFTSIRLPRAAKTTIRKQKAGLNKNYCEA